MTPQPKPHSTEAVVDVGIVMPCYNMGKYIEEAIESLTCQTFKDFIVIIADDASTDGVTPGVLRALKIPDNMSIVFEKKNLGPAGIRNKYIRKFKTKYIFPFDSDDMIDPNFLKKSVDYLESNPNKAAVAPWIECFGAETGIIKLSENQATLPAMLIRNNFLGACLLRKKAFDQVHGYDDSRKVQGAEDYDLWLSILEDGWSLGVIPEALYKYRRLENSLSSVSATPKRSTELREYIVNKHHNTYSRYMKEVISEFEKKASDAHSGYLETRHQLDLLIKDYETLHVYVEDTLLPQLHQYEKKAHRLRYVNPKNYLRRLQKYKK